eukprot:6205438-Pleurochrysis_carterae.AAC.6
MIVRNASECERVRASAASRAPGRAGPKGKAPSSPAGRRGRGSRSGYAHLRIDQRRARSKMGLRIESQLELEEDERERSANARLERCVCVEQNQQLALSSLVEAHGCGGASGVRMRTWRGGNVAMETTKGADDREMSIGRIHAEQSASDQTLHAGNHK